MQTNQRLCTTTDTAIMCRPPPVSLSTQITMSNTTIQQSTDPSVRQVPVRHLKSVSHPVRAHTRSEGSEEATVRVLHSLWIRVGRRG
jgi:hypothetical protein